MDRISGDDYIDLGGGRRGFRDRNMVAGAPGTELTAAWLNGAQEEMLGIIEACGLTADAASTAQLLAAVRSQRLNWAGTFGGTPDALTATLSPAPAALTPGMVVRAKITATNTGAATFNANSLGALPITLVDGTALGGGELVPGVAELCYDGAAWALLSMLPLSFLGGIHGNATSTAAGSWSWTCPAGVYSVQAYVTGGGGGGQGCGTGQIGGTGGAGATAIKRIPVTPGTTYTGVAGAAGLGGASAGGAGGTGGTSSFGGASATGGGPGSAWVSGVGGTASGGDVNIAGGDGMDGNGNSSAAGTSITTNGGASFWGGGASSGVANTGTTAASVPGAGGAAQYSIAGPGNPGGLGKILLKW